MESGANALAAAEKQIFDAILLCVELADTDGREVCRRIRRKGIHIPIIMLSAQQGEADLILSLEVGADDHITKPIRTPVLLARLRALLRQCEWSEQVTCPVGPYVPRPGEKVLHHTADDRDITLTDKECALLKLLYQAGDAGIDNDKLYREIWGHTTPLATHALQTHVYRLRRKMETDPSNPEIILSGPGGYRLARRPK